MTSVSSVALFRGQRLLTATFHFLSTPFLLRWHCPGLFLSLRDNWLFNTVDWHLLGGFTYKTGFSHGGQRKATLVLFSPPVCLGPLQRQSALVWDSCLDFWGGRDSISHQPGHVLRAVATQTLAQEHCRVAALRPGKTKEDPVTLQGGRVCRLSHFWLPVASRHWDFCGHSRAPPG